MISFIIPIYNAEAYLALCIESIQTQRGDVLLEIILIDDQSTDSSLSIAQRYAKADERITVLTQPHAGQSAARNLGLKHAKGEYIAFVDADDKLSADWCTQHLNAIQGVDYVQSGYQRVSSDGTPLPNSKESKGRIPKHTYQFTSPCMRLYTRSVLQDMHFEEGIIYEDILFSAQLWIKIAQCKRINYTGYLYTLNPNSTTAQVNKKAQDIILHHLRQLMKGQSLKNKLIILLTIIRLTLHFARL